MIRNLEAQELVHRVERLAVGGDDIEPPSRRRLHVGKPDPALQCSHPRRARDVGVVNQHRRRIIAVAKHLRDMRQVPANGVAIGGISFVAHGEALPALIRACATNPSGVDELLERAEPFYHGLRERVGNGLAMFDERNTPGHYDAIHDALRVAQPDESPLFRVVDDETREASLRPVKAGAIVINLIDRRIVQLQNAYREIKRSGRSQVWDGERMTSRVFTYRLPNEWALVP